MIFRQITHDDLGCASYLVGDKQAGIAAVVDPKLEVEEYLELARFMGVRLELVLENHNHADHVSGHGRLVAATGATIHVHRAAEPDYEHDAIDDGWELELGALRIRAIHTPGHRPEHTAFALTDCARGEEPWAVLSGDTLFVGDVARPDLAVDKRDGARDMFHSLHDRLLALPDRCEVWPAHLGGSMCGGPGMDMKVSSTIGYERAHSRLLQITDEERFVEAATATLGPQPPNFEGIVAINRGRFERRERAITPLTTRQLDEADALIVDVRTDREFDEAHVPGAVCNPAIRAGFGTKLAWLVNPDQDIVLIGRDDADALRAARLAASVGVIRIAGYLGGGMTSWRQEGLPTRSVERIDPEELMLVRRTEPDLQILDVRERADWESQRIPGSFFTPYHDLHELPAGMCPDRPVAVICASGQRSAVAASLLLPLGVARVLHVADGGVGTWAENGGGVETAAAAA